MNRVFVGACGMILAGLVARADTLTLTDGKTVRGLFAGYSNRKFEFKTEEGTLIKEYPLKIKTLTTDTPVTVSAKFSGKKYDSIDFVGFDNRQVQFSRDGQAVREPIIMLQSIEMTALAKEAEATLDDPLGARQPSAGGRSGGGRPPPSLRESQPRKWDQSGKWGEVQSSLTSVISHGEVVDIESKLKRGVVNVVHFHLPGVVSSVRQGTYVESLAAKRSNRMVVLKLDLPGFDAPVCDELRIKSLPQFWIYDGNGKLVKKLTDRFTEADIDAALKSARSGRSF